MSAIKSLPRCANGFYCCCVNEPNKFGDSDVHLSSYESATYRPDPPNRAGYRHRGRLADPWFPASAARGRTLAKSHGNATIRLLGTALAISPRPAV